MYELESLNYINFIKIILIHYSCKIISNNNSILKRRNINKFLKELLQFHSSHYVIHKVVSYEFFL